MEWKTWVFDLPKETCLLVKEGLKDLMPFSPHSEYIQFMYDIGGHGYEYNHFFAGCLQ